MPGQPTGVRYSIRLGLGARSGSVLVWSRNRSGPGPSGAARSVGRDSSRQPGVDCSPGPLAGRRRQLASLAELRQQVAALLNCTQPAR